MVEYELLGTGSSGNCIIYEKEVMVDCGVPYKKIVGHIANVKVLLLSHTHQDHVNQATIKRLARDLPNLAILCGVWWKSVLEGLEMADTVKIVYCEQGKMYKLGNMMISPVSLYHDVLNYGWRIIVNGQKIFHATDTVKMEGITAQNYDLISLEAHHITSIIDKQIEDKLNAGIFCYEVGAKNSHLSEEDCDKWLDENKSEHTQILKLHYSSCYELVDGKLRLKDVN